MNIQGKCYKSTSATMLHRERQIQDDNVLEVLKVVERVPPLFLCFTKFKLISQSYIPCNTLHGASPKDTDTA